MGQSSQYPLRDEVLALEGAARIAWLNGFVRNQIASHLKIPSTQVPGDDDFNRLVTQLGLGEDKRNDLIISLFDAVKKSFDLHFFYFERKIDKISLLSKLLSEQMQVIWKPDTPPPIADMHAEPHNWPWITPARFANDDKIARKTVFLLSCPRSGSTISRLILAGHPQLFSPPELHLLPFASMGEREEQIRRNGFEWMRAGLVDTFVELEKLDYTQAHARYDDLVVQDISIATVYELLQQMIGDRTLVDKTPFYACHPDWLATAEQLFAAPKYIFLSRHPYGMISSFVKLRLKDLTLNQFGPVDDNAWRLGEKWWFSGNSNIIAFLESIPDSRQFSVRYEDLIAESEKHVAQICEFLEIDFIESLLNPYANSSDVMIKGVGDPNILAYTEINKSLADAWKKTPPPQELSPDTRALAKYLRYTLL